MNADATRQSPPGSLAAFRPGHAARERLRNFQLAREALRRDDARALMKRLAGLSPDGQFSLAFYPARPLRFVEAAARADAAACLAALVAAGAELTPLAIELAIVGNERKYAPPSLPPRSDCQALRWLFASGRLDPFGCGPPGSEALARDSRRLRAGVAEAVEEARSRARSARAGQAAS